MRTVLFPALAITALTLGTQGVASGYTVYDIESEWRENAGNSARLDFSPVAGPVTGGGMTYDGPGHTLDIERAALPYGTDEVFVDGFTIFLENTGFVAITFDAPVRGFAADIAFSSQDPAVPTMAFEGAGDFYLGDPTAFRPGGGETPDNVVVNGFFGIVSEEGITRFYLNAPGTQHYVTFRNIEVSGATVVPVPAAYLGGGALFALLGFVHWYRKRRLLVAG